MHMADALISPAVGGTMWAATAGIAAYSIKKLQSEIDEKKIALMGVLGAFVFAAQMINFTIPGTGSSGHLGGGMLLAILLGPFAGFLTMASVLIIQALFFADGGFLATGCNIFNLGFFTCMLAYPLIYKPIISKGYTPRRIFMAGMLSAIIGLQLGAFGVVLQTLASGISELPFGTFVALMQPIHLGIGIVEGLVVTAIVSFVWKERPEIIEKASMGATMGSLSIKKVLTGLTIAAMLAGGIFSWFASANPDGLEWSMFKTSGVEELEAPDGIHKTLAAIQEKTAFLPDYGFKTSEAESEPAAKEGESTTKAGEPAAAEGAAAWPAVSGGTSLAGILGAAITLAFTAVIGFAASRFKKRTA